ncbi:MAG: M48 family metallopeptidase [Clostridiaceae bacterium]
MEKSNSNHYPTDVAAYSILAVRALVGTEDFLQIAFTDDSSTHPVPDFKEESLQLLHQGKILSENQSIALFSYLYLYVRLTGKEQYQANLTSLKQTLHISEGVERNLEFLITDERVEYILNDYKKRRKSLAELFISTEDYISDMITDVVTAPIQQEKSILTGLQSSEYEHPTDRIALEKLRLNKTLELLIKWYSEYNMERLLTVQYTGSNVLVTEKNLPYLHAALTKVCQILDVDPIPPLYLEQGFISAQTIGSSHPIVCISSACLSLLSYDELLFILGHEVGHIKSQHVLYHSLGNLMPYVGEVIGSLTFGVGELVSSGLVLALYNWYRKSEFTADRAGLLACQNPDAAISVMTKLAGFPPKYYGAINTEDFLNQAADFENLDNSKFNKVMKILSAMYQNHPWTVIRAQELNQWVLQGDYNKTLARLTAQLIPAGVSSTQGSKNTCYCTQCGNELDRDAKFCSHCGSPNKKQ